MKIGEGLTEKEKEALDSLDYEGTRSELEKVVKSLEAGGLSLEESVRAWEKGQYLASRARAMLEKVKKRIDRVQEERKMTEGLAGTQRNLRSE